jgi:hypothetical protein
MATIEGLGTVAPRPYRVALSKGEIDYAASIAERRNEHRGYSSYASRWKRGVCANPALIGTVGEMALQKHLMSRGVKCRFVDESLNDGDGGVDGFWCGKTYQVKTTQQFQPRELLVRRVKHDGTIESLKADRYVFCQWQPGSTEAFIFGWCGRDVVLQSPFKRTHIKDQKWFNNIVDPKMLNSAESLVHAMRFEANGI